MRTVQKPTIEKPVQISLESPKTLKTGPEIHQFHIAYRQDPSTAKVAKLFKAVMAPISMLWVYRETRALA